MRAVIGRLRGEARWSSGGLRDCTPPPPRTPWDAARWCVVDLELSGLDPRRPRDRLLRCDPDRAGARAAAAGCLGARPPERPLGESSIRIHGIRAADLAHAPPLHEAIGPLLEAMAGRVLVAHVAHVERAFLGRALRREGLRLRGGVADTSVVGRLWLCERDGDAPADPCLRDLAIALGLPVHAQHDALGDSLTAAQVFIASATHLDALGGETVRSLLRADRRLRARLEYPPETR